MSKGKPWGGRFTKATNQLVEEYTASIGFDYKLAKEDIQGSIAHATMLGSKGIITDKEVELIVNGLKEIELEISRGHFKYSVALEDIHMNIEKRLIDLIGSVGGKLHTARSRNDQVALDMHIYLKKNVKNIANNLSELIEVFIEKAEQNLDVVMPGYTHLQRAQPILFSHHLMAYASMFLRDLERLNDSWKRIDIMPLGAGALAGTTFSIDRKQVADLLGFDKIYTNSMDAVSDRDYIAEFLFNSSLIMMHLSRLSEELILWMSSEFQYVELDDAYCTGSSIMPQKKNPDVAELVRGKTGRVYGNLISLLTTLKGLPMTYNKDMQEDKEGMFDTIQTLEGALTLVAGMVQTMVVNKERMLQSVKNDFSNATDYADYLVRKGIPFREAHEIVGKTVLYCIEAKKYLLDLTIEEYQNFSTKVEEDIYNQLLPENVVNARISYGGTGRESVVKGINEAKDELSRLKGLSIY
ncbi:MAG: argininosuccinate lyase [Vulcanibacillus sp.]